MAKPKKVKLTKKQKRRRRKIARIESDPLYNPSVGLAGRDLKRTAGALTKISTKPAISAARGYLKTSRKAQKQDVKALGRLGKRLDIQAGRLGDKMEGYGNEAIGIAEGQASDLSRTLAARSQAATDNLNKIQNSTMGKSIAQMESLGMDKDSSASSQALQQLAAQQRATQQQTSAAWENLGSFIGNATVASAQGAKDASMRNISNQQLAMARNIASRQVQRRQEGQAERMEGRRELKTLKSLKGAEKLKNLMGLRSEQQQFQLGQQEILAQMAMARADRKQANKDRKLDWYRALSDNQQAALDRASREKIAKIGNKGSGGSGGGNKLWDRPNKLSGNEFGHAKAAAFDILGKNKTVGNWNEFLDRVESAEGISWSAKERAKFRKRFKKKFPGRA